MLYVNPEGSHVEGIEVRACCHTMSGPYSSQASREVGSDGRDLLLKLCVPRSLLWNDGQVCHLCCSVHSESSKRPSFSVS
eukprot:764664-Hanusia_phi.AAC.2